MHTHTQTAHIYRASNLMTVYVQLKQAKSAC